MQLGDAQCLEHWSCHEHQRKVLDRSRPSFDFVDVLGLFAFAVSGIATALANIIRLCVGEW